MDLILWRHAEAAEGGSGIPDADRNLTERGKRQAKKMAEWLLAQNIPKLSMIVSPTKRTIQTAESFGKHYKVNRKLGPGATAADLLAAANWPDESGAIVLVGHQHGLGRLAALLLAGAEADWTIKKAGIWWFTNRVRHEESQTVLRAVSNP